MPGAWIELRGTGGHIVEALFWSCSFPRILVDYYRQVYPGLWLRYRLDVDDWGFVPVGFRIPPGLYPN